VSARRLYRLTLFLLTLIPASALASDFHSPRTMSLGGAGHAAPLLNDAIYLNPSFTSLVQSYGIASSYLKFKGDQDSYGRLYNVSIQDGRTELFQAGVGYTWREDGALVHVGAAKSFIQRVGVGIGTKFFLSRGSLPMAREANISATGVVTEWLQFALVIDNLMQSEESRARDLYREITIGSKVTIMHIAMVYFDPHLVPSMPGGEKLGLETGLEFTIFKDLFARAGFFKNSTVPFQAHRGMGFGLGAGWVGPRISLDYGFQKVMSSLRDLPAATAHSLGVTVFF
jgi:hypothetical protein